MLQMDIASAQADVEEARETRQNAAIAVSSARAQLSGLERELQETARKAGATLVVNETAITTHLPQFLEQALRVE